MYRKPRRSPSEGILNLDSLMDILSCLVGVMLFMVMYTVLELGSTAFQVSMPAHQNESPTSRQVVVFCVDGTVRVVDMGTTLTGFATGLQNISFLEAPAFVANANERGRSDDLFDYSLSYEDLVDDMGARSRVISLEVAERQGVVGDSVHQIGPGSRYTEALSRLSSRSWVHFVLDGQSLDVFRVARQMATDRGLGTGWSPMDSSFPVRFPFTASGRLELDRASALRKPRR